MSPREETVQPENPTTFTFDEFTARKNARQAAEDLPAQLQKSIERVNAAKASKARRKPPAAEPEPPATLAEVLRQAVSLAMARRSRESREVLVREQGLLEVLSDAMRRDA